MTEDKQKNCYTLLNLACYTPGTVIDNVREASEWALNEIERLTQENADLKSKLERESTENLTKTIAAMAIIGVEKETEIKRLIENNWKLQSKIDPITQKLILRDWVTRDLVEE